MMRPRFSCSTPRFLQPTRSIYIRVIVLLIHPALPGVLPPDPARMVNKKPAEAGFFCGVERLERLDVRRLQALRPFLHLELDLLAFLQRLEAVHLDRGVMREQIFAAFSRGDEAEAFRVVEPLDGTGCHYCFLLLKVATKPGTTKPGTTIKEGN